MNYKQIENYILNIPKFRPEGSIEQARAFYEFLGKPGKDRTIVHVAGTNGKGSTCAYMNSVLTEAGYKVGMFTSPHLVSVRERIRINHALISEQEFIHCFQKIQELVTRYNERVWEQSYIEYLPTFYEFLFFMAMLYFEGQDTDIIILETGLGGRLDATNVISRPMVTVITSVGLDHTDILGDTYESIAAEKAGIIKPGVPVIYDGSNETVNAVIKGIAKERNAQAVALMPSEISDVTVGDKSIDFCLHNKYYDNELFCVNSHGLYQVKNAALAALAMKVSNMADTAAIKEGICGTIWKARMQEISRNVIIDGAHNDDGVNMFIESVNRDGCDAGRILLFSAVSDKHYEGMIDKLCNSCLFEIIITGCMEDARALDGSEMKRVFSKYTEQNTEYYGSVREAYDRAMKLKVGNKRLYIAGSLYLAGEVLAITEGDNT